MQALHDAILDALLNGGVLSDEMLERLLDGTANESDERDRAASAQPDRRAGAADHRAAHRAGLHHMAGKPARAAARRPGRPGTSRDSRASRSPTRRSTSSAIARLRDLLGSIGRSSAGRHDTRELDTRHRGGRTAAAIPVRRHDEPGRGGDGAERGAATLRRLRGPQPGRGPRQKQTRSARVGIDLDYEDLMVAQGDYQSSCATVLLLDCSHSMVLYGEDRFTPAKRVAMALANLIRHQYPGDALHGRALPRLRGGSADQRDSAGSASGRITRTRAKVCGWRAACSIASARTCGRSS